MGSKSNQELLEEYKSACISIAEANSKPYAIGRLESSKSSKSSLYHLEKEILFRMDKEDISLIHSFGRSCSSIRLCEIKGCSSNLFKEKQESTKNDILEKMT